MSKAVHFLKYWAPVLLWMGAIFAGSGDRLSSQHTSRVIGPILRWLVPSISEEAIGRVQFVVRKGGHMTEYAVLSALVWRALREPRRADPRPWSWSNAGAALAVAVLYAASDEFHQSFVPSREGSPVDVMIDGAGAAVGLAALYSWDRWRRARRSS